MKKMSVSLMLAFSALQAINYDMCGVITDVLQTRNLNSQIKMLDDGDTSYIKFDNKCLLNTSSVYSDSYDHGLVCDLNGNNKKDSEETMAKATGKYAKKLDIDYTFSVEESGAGENPSDSSLNEEVTNYKKIFTGDKYNQISQDSNRNCFRWAVTSTVRTIAINYFKDILNSVEISNIEDKIVQIGKFETAEYDSTSLKFEGVPSEIDIGTIQTRGSNQFSATFEAKDSVKIHNLDLNSSAQNTIIIKSPKVVIDNLNSTNNDNTIEIYADEIDLGNAQFAQNTKLILHPYSASSVKFYAGEITQSSSSSMILDSGDYYIKQMNFHSDADTTPIKASNTLQRVNVFIDHDVDIPSGNFINSENRGVFGANPAKNFRMFINGDLIIRSANVTLNGIFYVEGKTDIETDAHVRGAISSGDDITIGNDNDFVWGDSMKVLLASCVSHIKYSIDSNFDAIDPFDITNYLPSDKKIIKTKIVNKTFPLMVVAKNSTGGLFSLDSMKTIKFNIINMENNATLTNWRDYPGVYNVSQASQVYKNYFFTIDKAVKDARVVFKICKDASGNTLNYDECDHECVVDSTRPCWEYSLSSDNFAIMPYKFDVTASADSNGVYVDFKALDFKGNVVKNYNESVGDTFDVTYAEEKTSCVTGKFDYDGGKDINESWSFADGVKHLDLNYSETGNVNIVIKDKEKCEDRFNAVDCDDYTATLNSSDVTKNITGVDEKDQEVTLTVVFHAKALSIQPATTSVFVPVNHFDAEVNVLNFKGGSFTYLANNINEMNATLDLNISAKNYKNENVENYTSVCYAKDVNVNLQHNSLSSYFVDVNTTQGVMPADANISFDISKDEFSSSTISKTVKFNLNRKVDQPVNPQSFYITAALITNEDKPKSNNTFSGNALFYYGYFYIPKNVDSYFTNVKSQASYKYYKDGVFLLSQNHPSDIDIKHIVVDKVSYSLSPITMGRELITYSYNGELPYSTVGHIAIPSYLWYSENGNSYIEPKDNDENSLDCAHQPCQKITFYSTAKGFSGVKSRKASDKFSETNSTLKEKAYQELNTTKHSMPRVIW